MIGQHKSAEPLVEALPQTPEDERHYVGSIFARARALDFADVETLDRERE